MGDENPICTLEDDSKPSHEGYRNTIEKRAGSITTWEDLTTRFLAQFFPPGRTAKLRNDILMFQQHHGESLSESWTLFKDLLQKVPHHGIDLWLQAGGKLRDQNAEESWALLEDLALYDNESWNDPRDFAKPVKAITLPQDVLSTSDRRLIELENQVQCLIEAHLAPTQPTQVHKITTSCEICSGPHDTQYCMDEPEQAFVEYASSCTNEAGEGLVSNFMASQDARLSKFEANFKQQQSEMTNKIDTVLKAITNRIAGSLPSDTVKNPKLSTSLVLSACSYPNMDPQCSNHIHGSINVVTIHSEKQSDSYDEKSKENEEEEKDSLEGEPEEEGRTTTKGVGAEYFDIFPTRSELAYHKYLMCGPIPLIFLRNHIITEGCHRTSRYHATLGNFTYVIDFMIVEDISSIIDPRLSQVVLGRPFVEISNMTHDPPKGVVRFTNGTDEVAYKMPHKIEQYNSLSDLEKEHTKSVYLRNEEDKRK
ncbi:MAK10-like protein [Tanacetum coccineum]